MGYPPAHIGARNEPLYASTHGTGSARDDCGDRGVARFTALKTRWLCIAGHVGGRLGFSCLELCILRVEVQV